MNRLPTEDADFVITYPSQGMAKSGTFTTTAGAPMIIGSYTGSRLGIGHSDIQAPAVFVNGGAIEIRVKMDVLGLKRVELLAMTNVLGDYEKNCMSRRVFWLNEIINSSKMLVAPGQ